MQITKHRVASIHYTLRNDEGEVLDSSEGGDPLQYMHGVGGLIPGMEAALEGQSTGDDLSIKIAPADGYGERSEEMVQAVPRNLFQDVDKIEPGMQFMAQSEQGPQPVRVVSVGDDEVTIDANHPLAGVTLHFSVQVVDVREATEEEIFQGRAQQPGECCGGNGGCDRKDKQRDHNEGGCCGGGGHCDN